jgi:LysM repeat protein
MATQVTYQIHTVEQGQTLWEISKKYYPNKDPREIIYDVKQLNNIDSIIYPGQQIMLPDYK